MGARKKKELAKVSQPGSVGTGLGVGKAHPQTCALPVALSYGAETQEFRAEMVTLEPWCGSRLCAFQQFAKASSNFFQHRLLRQFRTPILRDFLEGPGHLAGS